MQSNQQKKGKQNFIGVKILIGAVSLAGTFGLWNLFAASPTETLKPSQEPGKNNQQTPNSYTVEFPAMPTLVPVLDPNTMQSQTQSNVHIPASGLRQVTQPTPVPSINNKPVFERLTINRPGMSGSTSSGSSR